jgi:hypothetical protein
VRIVAKLLEAFNDDWHWVNLHDAELVDASLRVYRISGADTVCGIFLSGPNTTRLHETGAPPEPDCAACLDGGGLDPSEMVRLAQELATAVPVPVIARPSRETRQAR